MIEWLIVCFYLASISLLVLFLKSISSVRNFTWRLSFRLVKLLVSLFLSLMFFMVAQQLSKFFASDIGTQVSEIYIRYLDTQKYLLSIKRPQNPSIESSFEINGDDWQMDLRLLTWNKFFASIGIDSLYQIERLSGRYQSVENELYAKRSIYNLTENTLTDPLWFYLLPYAEMSVFRAHYGAALYAPMVDQAKYGVFLTDAGAEILPLNDEAKKALTVW